MPALDLGFRLVKIADIGYITVLYFITGFILARLFDKYIVKYNQAEEDQKSNLQIIAELCLYLWITGVAIYIFRNLIQLLPSPFEGLYNFKHLIVREVIEAPILSFTIIYYQTGLQDKLKNLYNKI